MGQLKERETDITKQILDWLWSRGIFSFKLGTGQFYGSHQGRSWAFRSHSLGPGCADILCLPADGRRIWIEVKRSGRGQRAEQKQFETFVNEWGHTYLVATSIDDLAGIV